MKYQRIVLHIEALIKEGTLISGSKLPSIRLLANELNCSKSTVLKAYEILENNRVAYSIEKTGYFLMSNPKKILPSENINFSSFKCDCNLLSYKEYQYAFNQLMASNKEYLGDGNEPEGLFALRETLKRYFLKKKIFTNVHDIVITSGAQQAFNVILTTILKPNNQILIENPTYTRFLDILKHSSFKNNVQTFMRKDDEIDFNIIEYHFLKHNIKLLYLTPNFHKPLSLSMNLKEKLKLLELCYKYNVFIIEDNYLEDINEYEETQSLYALDKHDIVFHVKSFSKVFSSILRLAVVVCPREFTKDIIGTKKTFDLHSSIMDQAVLEHFLSHNSFVTRKNEISNVYEERMNVLRRQFENIKLKEGYVVHIPCDGIFAFIEVPFSFNLQTMFNDLQKHNITLKGIENNFYHEHHFKGFIISVASTTKKDIAKGANIIIDYITTA